MYVCPHGVGCGTMSRFIYGSRNKYLDMPFKTTAFIFVLEKLHVSALTHHKSVNTIQWNLGSRTPLITNASPHEQIGSRTPLITNKSGHEQIFREKKTSRVTNGVSSNKHASRQQRLATSWEYRRERVRCCITFAHYTSLLEFAVPSLEFLCVLWFFYVYY
jgi:hypothetical protein